MTDLTATLPQEETALEARARERAADRVALQQIFIRVCRDSGFQMEATRAACLAARIVGRHPLDIWQAMPSLGVMDEIAAGTHPAALA